MLNKRSHRKNEKSGKFVLFQVENTVLNVYTLTVDFKQNNKLIINILYIYYIQ